MAQQLDNLALVEPAESLENTQVDEDGMDQGVDDEVESNAAELHTVSEHESETTIASEPENELDAPTVIEKLERPLKDQSDAILNEITIEDTQRFADFLAARMEEAWRDEANRLAQSPDDDDIDDDFFDPNRPQPAWLTHLGNECDCKKWLYIEHPQVREDTVNRLYERSGPGTESHNTLVVAIFAFCIQNQILSRPELAEFRRKLENSDAGLDQWTWDWLRKLIQYPYAGRRLKSNKQGYEPNHVRESKDKYEAFLKDAQQQFRLFFEDGEKNLRKNIFESANPGLTFICVRCNEKFPTLYGIHCKSQEVTADDENDANEEAAHHMCRPCFREQLANEIQLTNKRTIRCFKEDCTSYIEPDKVKKYLPRGTRRRLHELIQQKLGSEV
uniref:Uncharacterized protein n=1 Tax=Acrobeloides nanus TaxID=290746 RepID=A0A914CT20_9BILA